MPVAFNHYITKNNLLAAGSVYINQKQIDLNLQTDTLTFYLVSVKVVHSLMCVGE